MTLSITARCSRTGQLGVALSSFDVQLTFLPTFDGHAAPRFFSLVVPDLGAVTGQANTLTTFQAVVMEHLRSGLNAQTALDQALSEETEAVRDGFQVAVVDAAGAAAAFTGGRPHDWRGHRIGNGWVAAGNILAGEAVVDAVAEAFERGEESALDDRLLIALEAGIAAGATAEVIGVATCGWLRPTELRTSRYACTSTRGLSKNCGGSVTCTTRRAISRRWLSRQHDRYGKSSPTMN